MYGFIGKNIASGLICQSVLSKSAQLFIKKKIKVPVKKEILDN